MRISHYLMVPILIAIIVLIGSWWVVYDRTASLQTAQAELVLAENRDLRFRAMTNELSSLLILGDLIVASNQTFLLLAYEEQTRSIDSELNYFSDALSACCDPEAVKAAQLHLNSMEEAANEASVARTATVSGNWLDIFDQNSTGILEAFNRLEEVLTLNRNALSNTLGKQQETYLLAFVTTVLGSLISLSSLAWWISTRVTRPISRLSTNATEAIKGVKFLGLEKGPSELTELSDTLTTLTGGLQNALDQERAQVIEQQREIQSQIEKTALIQRQSLNRLDIVIRAANARVWECSIKSEDLINETELRQSGKLNFGTLEASSSEISFSAFRQEDLSSIHHKLLAHIHGKEPLELRVRLNQGGEDRWFQLNGQLVDQTENNFELVGSLIDIQSNVEQELQITQIAMTDSLTELPNRRAFTEAISVWLDSSDEFVLVTLDIDDFKTVNDHYGHVVGDKALAFVGAILESLVKTPSLVARLGGDEFALLLSSTNATAVETILTEANTQAKAFSTVDLKLPLTLSAGVARYPVDGPNQESLMLAGELAVYRANSYRLPGCRLRWFEPSMSDSFNRRTTVYDGIVQSLAADSLLLHLQPIVNIANGKIEAFEALLRWPNSIGCSTSEFINIAEQSGLILDVTAWVIQNSAKTAAQLKQAGFTTTLSINLPAQSFQYQDVPKLLQEATETFQLPVSALAIELTESAFIDNRKVTQNILDDLAAMGVRIALDDFGTGYSSLSYLHELTVHRIKIDRSFIEDIRPADARCSIVASIIDLGDKLNAQVVIEGVETEEELMCLRDLGASYIQGYYYSRPQPLEHWLLRGDQHL